LSAGELGAFYRTPRRISDARVINLPESGGQIFLWNEDAGNGGRTPHYAVSPDGKTVATIREVSYEMMLRYAKFDPLAEVPAAPDNLTARSGASSEFRFRRRFQNFFIRRAAIYNDCRTLFSFHGKYLHCLSRARHKF
jgi:hypothetical protein